jgi:thiol-disulfide isomerase/thioredoxin
VLSLALAACVAPAARADDEAPAASPSGAKSSGRYDLPAGGVKELLAFVKDIQGFQPSTPREIEERRLKAYRAVETALARIAQIATDEDKKLAGFADAMGLHLVFRTAVFGEGPGAGTPAEQQKLIDDIKANLRASPQPSKHAISAAMKVAAALEYGRPSRQAVDVCRQFGEILSASPQPAAAAAGVTLRGKARRLDLVGKPLEIAGTLAGGEKLEWKAYRGRVVLIEVWATWCGPCLEELEHVRACYEKYHDRGFDVLGVNVDEDREALDRFLKKQPFPWTTLYDAGRDDGFAAYYGITGAFAAILVDRQGKVVSLNVRGEELSRQIATLLGPAGSGGK